MKAVDELLCGVQSSEDETECVEEVEILMEDEEEKVERGRKSKVGREGEGKLLRGGGRQAIHRGI